MKLPNIAGEYRQLLILLIGGITLGLWAKDAGPLPGDLLITHRVQQLMAPDAVLLQGSDWLGALVTSLPWRVAIIALLTKQWRLALLLAVSGALLAYVVEDQLKLWFPRFRPTSDMVNVYQVLEGYSFPSGTAVRTMGVLGTVILFCRTTEVADLPGKIIIALCLALVLLTNLARLWLGVHWASDILGGWLFGAGWALLTWMFYQRYIAKEVRDA